PVDRLSELEPVADIDPRGAGTVLDLPAGETEPGRDRRADPTGSASNERLHHTPASGPSTTVDGKPPNATVTATNGEISVRDDFRAHTVAPLDDTDTSAPRNAASNDGSPRCTSSRFVTQSRNCPTSRAYSSG